jgi:hypothetical protein
MRSDFEQTVAHILPYCPVAKKKTLGAKRGAGEISSVDEGSNDAPHVASFGTKNG